MIELLKSLPDLAYVDIDVNLPEYGKMPSVEQFEELKTVRETLRNVKVIGLWLFVESK